MLASSEVLDRAIDWIAEHSVLGDVLITGGDPGVMTDQVLTELFGRLAESDHVYRHVDVPVFEYLERLAERGGDLADYRTIWYSY